MNDQNMGPRCCATCLYYSHMVDLDDELDESCSFGERSRSVSCFSYCKHWRWNERDDASRLISIEALDEEEDRLEAIGKEKEEKRRAAMAPWQREAEDAFREMWSKECTRRIQQNLMIDQLVGSGPYDFKVKIGCEYKDEK